MSNNEVGGSSTQSSSTLCSDVGYEQSDAPDEEVLATEKVVNAFFFYKQYARERTLSHVGKLRHLTKEHQLLIGERHSDHIRKVLKCIDENDKIIRIIVNYGIGMFGEELMQALRIHQNRRPDPHYMTKVPSTLRQIVREWSIEGKTERDATYSPIFKELSARFGDRPDLHEVRILVPGSGLGRLAFDLSREGYTVQGNEFSLFMLITSCFLLNACAQENQHTIYPFALDRSNCWSYEDQIRPVTFPDACPDQNQLSRLNAFSMCAGNFVEISRNQENMWDSVVTAWFIDTANNIIDYIESIYRILKPGGAWINVGPLLYHFEDMKEEDSVELPYEEVIRIAKAIGFKIENETTVTSNYARNVKSMSQNTFTCPFFVGVKQ